MKLQNSLYTIVSEQTVGTAIRYDIRLDATHQIYQAHFPGEPITPGVCIIQIAKELLEEQTRRSMMIEKVKNVKFLSIISPVQTPQVTYVVDKLKTADDGLSMSAQIQVFAGDQPMAKLSFVCSLS
jgi:3-hydroxyacyl-[acyl-carrier-protein] dehydratase